MTNPVRFNITALYAEANRLHRESTNGKPGEGQLGGLTFGLMLVEHHRGTVHHPLIEKAMDALSKDPKLNPAPESTPVVTGKLTHPLTEEPLGSGSKARLEGPALALD